MEQLHTFVAEQLWALVVGVDDSGLHAALDGCRTKCSFSSANLSRTERGCGLAIDPSTSGDGASDGRPVVSGG